MFIITLNARAIVLPAWRNRFARNVAVVASGAAAAQVITMAFAPLITRIYGPAAFGVLGAFMAIVAVATPIAALAYPIAIVLPRDDCDALGLVRLSAVLSFGIALFATALLAMGGDYLTATLGIKSVAGYLFLIPMAMLYLIFPAGGQRPARLSHYWTLLHSRSLCAFWKSAQDRVGLPISSLTIPN